MFGYQMNEYDKQVYQNEIENFLPDKIIDAHMHVYLKEFARETERSKALVSWTEKVAQDCSIEDLEQTYRDMFPGKQVTPVIMGNPTSDLVKTNSYITNLIHNGHYNAYYCTSFDTPLDEIRHAIVNLGYCGIKPYLSNAPAYIPGDEVRIFDFLPQEHLQLMNELKGTVMLHIPRSVRLKDPVNLMQILEIEHNYPDLQLIVAHVGRAYAPEDIGNAFELLKETKNLVFDFCANTQYKAMEECLKAVGPQRLLFGTDLPVLKMRMRRVTESGVYYNIVPKGLYGDVSGDYHMRETETEQLTCFAYEEIRAFKKAAQACQLSKKDIEDVFYNNALRIFWNR